ncbi:transglutaminase domain-containing protein [Tenacibaculum xiamenense]|uniref:transglutaminase domain-containing protein n=1 Tax=Tenacibaculum xiamenense TaxID=1261553 RepID=UPI0038933852
MIKQFLIGILLISFAVKGQEKMNCEAVVAKYPSSLSAKRLAAKILKDFSSDEARSKAAFCWIANNIKYNLFAYRDPKRKVIGFRYRDEEDKIRKLLAIKDSIVDHTLKTKKAVCEGYAQTLSKIYTHLGLENLVIKGFVRNSIHDIGNEQQVPNHAWNVVKVDDEWRVVDATWAAGSVINGRWQQSYDDYYYDVPREHYLKTHFPENRRWKFGSRLSKEEFYSQPIYTTEFLRTNLELIEPLQGIIAKRKSKELTLKIKNLDSVQRVLYGISTNRYAQKPEITYKDSVGYVKIKSFRKSNRLFLVIDGKVHVEFKLI